jgi:hypothetical protein
MVGIRSARRVGAGLLVASVLGASAAVIHAQPAAPVAQLASFPDAQTALAAVAIDERAFFNSLLQTLESGAATFYFNTARLKADDDLRFNLVRTLGPILPRIVESDVFTGMYARARQEAARSRDGTPPVHPSIARADSISDLQLRVRGYQERLGTSGLSRRDRGSLEDQIETAQEQIARLERQAQDPAVRAADQAQMEAATRAYETQHQATLAALEADMPADARQLVRTRLEAFVAGCRDVNFHARTTTTGGVVRFTDPATEARPKIWKLCFRAGQRSVTEARRVATRWISRLPRAPRVAAH